MMIVQLARNAAVSYNHILLSRHVSIINRACIQQTSYSTPLLAASFSRSFSTTNDKDDLKSNTKNEFPKLEPFEDSNPDRIHSIRVNPDSVGSKVLPGNLVYKKYKHSGNTRKVPLELEHGYFWMMRDLQKCDNKPTLSNEMLIPEQEAQMFPLLTGLKTLSGVKADIPSFFMNDTTNNSKEETEPPKCTLVALSFRDYGYKQLSSWTEPFSKALESRGKARVVRVSITERASLYLLQWGLTSIMRRNTAVAEHDRTLVYFGTNVDEFRDVLRMHNLMIGYVFLVDEFGKIRFAGSGPATDEEAARVIEFGKQLSKPMRRVGGSNNQTRTYRRTKSRGRKTSSQKRFKQ